MMTGTVAEPCQSTLLPCLQSGVFGEFGTVAMRKIGYVVDLFFLHFARYFGVPAPVGVLNTCPGVRGQRELE
jgi:hypothetical protein